MARFRRPSLYKSSEELRAMVRPGLLTAQALDAVRSALRVGITTADLDAIAERVILEGGGVPNFQLVPGYQHTLCVSVNDEIVHGIPGERVIEAGDIVSIDAGAEVDGWNGDSAVTVVVPGGDPERAAARTMLADVTERSMWRGIAALATARNLNEIGASIEDAIDETGAWGIVEDFTGHGIGRSMHEDPPVFNYRVRGGGPAVRPGLAVAIEPMVTAGTIDSSTDADGWTVRTLDGSDAAHWEHSVAVHENGIWVLTAPDGGAAALAPLGVQPQPIA
ncbi:type I methionyl aminopeptidase [Curtobacterium sp. MCBD17_040]|uniref:type I methionyl aminopeptidase n=1 Tax=Curtobacterium sp. MCBD17_040 TaxID=2175674 RepID=UPI000DA75882|nr:type I methionyl aminopeptidase [Curtobacterium sp. MCBD17_040]WIB63885.1 type I methionyl aminopeptidase [Curtobacterium sp. MCBD17_040]